MAMNVGELFKFLNSDVCDEFYQELTYENKNDIINKMMNDEGFLEKAHQFVSDDNVIRSKIDTKLGQQLKKKPRLVTPHEIFLANLDGISEQLDNSKIVPGTNVVHSGPIVQANQEIDEIDEEKGKYIGSGIYLKREGHLIKMTTPTFSFYY